MNAEPILECVPNFSEGVHPDIVRQIVAAMQVEGVRLLDFSLDPDHNRSVVTIAGAPAAVVESAIAGAGKAAELIDLTRQTGVHPRIGAADVIPFVPVAGISIAEAAVLARQAGMQIWRRFGVPVYFYGASALRPDRVQLEDVRRGQFEGLREAALKRRHAAARMWAGRSCMRPPARVSWERAAFSSRTTFTLGRGRRFRTRAPWPGISARRPAACRASRRWVCWQTGARR